MMKVVVMGTIGLTLLGVASAAAAPPSSLSTDTPANESLSTKLNKSDGVITPKAGMDPGIHVPAPDPHPNSTPVVPPAATGGGTAK